MWIKQSEKVEQQVTTPIKILMITYHNGVKQAVAKRKILECVGVVEKLMFTLQMNKWKEKVVKWRRLKYLSVAETITLIL